MECLYGDDFDHRVLADSHCNSSSEHEGLLDDMVLDYLHLPRFPGQDEDRLQGKGQVTHESFEGDVSCLGNLAHIVDCLDDLSGVQPINWNLSVADFKDLLADSMDCEKQEFVYTSSPYSSSVSSQDLCSLTSSSETTDSSGNNSSTFSQRHSFQRDSGYLSRNPISNFLEEFGKSLEDEVTVPSPIPPAESPMSVSTASNLDNSVQMSSWCQEKQQQQQQQQQQFQQPQTLLSSLNHQPSFNRCSLRTMNSADEKPQESYVALVAKAIMSVPDHRMLLNDIYKHILDSYPYFNTAKCAWRSSVRHALSTNECFVKSGRAPNGRGSYCAIHSVSLQDFKNGDFNRRHARHRVQKLTRQTDALINNMTNQTPTIYHQTVAQSGDFYTPMTSTPVRAMDFSSSNMSYQYHREDKSQCPSFDVRSLPQNSAVFRFQQTNDFAGCFLNSLDH